MKTVTVIGAGVMGVDVATTLAANGYQVVLIDVDAESLANAPHRIKQNVRYYRLVSPDCKEWNAADILQRIKFTDNYKDIDCSYWVIENITENWEAKRKLYTELRNYCLPETCIGVNTSCLSITKIASILPYPERVIGMHFMNPVPLKEIVETVRGFYTSAETIQASESFLASIGKIPVLVHDSPGFVSNRLSHLFMNEAAFLVQENVAEPHQIDLMFKKGYGHKMGPLETADLIGLDTVVNSLRVLYESYQDPKFRCCPLLIRMVDAGLLGRKSGQGFYRYEE